MGDAWATAHGRRDGSIKGDDTGIGASALAKGPKPPGLGKRAPPGALGRARRGAPPALTGRIWAPGGFGRGGCGRRGPSERGQPCVRRQRICSAAARGGRSDSDGQQSASLDSEVEVLDVGEARAEARLGVVRDAVAAARRKGRAREGGKAGACHRQEWRGRCGDSVLSAHTTSIHNQLRTHSKFQLRTHSIFLLCSLLP